MIPLKIQIKNFLSYGPKLQEIDFGPYPLICLSGKNGHGKSALLDAMTWALWGQARKTSGTLKPDAQLLRLGQTTMLVIFDFIFNNQMYRVRREFALTKKGNPYASLEFGILERETEHLRPLTEKTIRDTQETIDRMLGLDYDAFVNSAFLRQGNANEFSKKSPKERKEILASILQLDKYETIRKAAMEKAKTANADGVHLKQLQEKIKQDLLQEEVLSQNLKTVQNDFELVLKNEQEQQNLCKNLEIEKEILAKQEQEQSLLVFKYEQASNELQERYQKIHADFTQWRLVNKKQHIIKNPSELEKEKNKLSTEVNRFIALQEKSFALKEQLLFTREHEQKILNQLRHDYTAQLHKKQFALERLQTDLEFKKLTLNQTEKKITELCHELEKLTNEHGILEKNLEDFGNKQESFTNIEQQFEKRKSHYHRWIAQANLLSSEKKNLEQKKVLIHDPNNPSCPLCEQNLSASRKKFLKNQFEKQEHIISHQLKRFTLILSDLKPLLVDQHKQLETLRAQKQQEHVVQARLNDIKNAITKKTEHLNSLKDEHKKNSLDFDVLTKNLSEQQKLFMLEQGQMQKEIESNPGYLELKNKCLQVQKALESLSYDPVQHKAAQQKLQELINQQQELANIQHEIKQQEQRKEEIFKGCQQLRDIKKKKEQLKKQIETLSIKQQKDVLLEKQTELQAILSEIQQKKEYLVHQKGSLEQQQRHLEKQKTELHEQEKKLADLQETMFDYQILATALSKDGIQALLIEDALPEIEQEANNLLADLTNNQAHIIIESLRDLKKGGTKETLDIKISDPMGIRPYEMFSGGEAFRIDFALRIAISKLLARRAGTSLQTLIIDEGFGSQDEEGLNHVMDAILKIQDNFSKVIIVSHLPAMKDQFPVHFVVNKGPQGSQVSIFEQG
jgi:exonuclease SbcC